MADQAITSNSSGDVIDLLIKRGMTLTAIADAIGVTKSFISRVRSRSRSLTVDHLVALEAAVGEPLPLLLLQATPPESIPTALRQLYKSTLNVVSGGRKPSKSAGRAKRKVA